MPGRKRCSSPVARAVSSRSVTEPTVAPSRARVPVSTRAISRSVGYPAQLIRQRIRPIQVQGRRLNQIGLPYHWGANGLSTGDSANDLAHLVLDPNVHIQEAKALACDIRPGRRPRGPALRELVREYARRAGITDDTGTEV